MTQWITELPASDSPRSGSLQSSLATPIDLDKAALLQNELEVAEEKADLRVYFLWGRRTDSDLEVLGPAWGAGLELTSSNVADQMIRCIARSITELAAQFLDSAPETILEPVADPQQVESAWLSRLHELRSRESTDIYEWYASFDDET